MNKEFPLWPNSSGIKGDPDLKSPLRENKIAVGIYQSLTVLTEPHLNPKLPEGEGNLGMPT